MENIFISHIHEEAPLAKVFKEELEATSVGQWEVFVSSDKGSVTLGDQWFSKIDTALTGHRLLLVLCSPASLSRLWIGYEVGYAAAKGVPIIPICHSGTKPAALPSFLSRYQGVELDADAFVKQLFEAIQKHVPLPRTPRISDKDIADKIKVALTQVTLKPEPTSVDQSSPINADIESEDYTKILMLLAHKPKGYVDDEQMFALLPVPRARIEYYVEQLRDQLLIEFKRSGVGGYVYSLTSSGRKYLLDKKMT